MDEITRRHDPRALIREAYAMDGLTPADCRSIFLDWALGLPVGADSVAATAALLAAYAPESPDHPMTAVLREGGGQPRPRLRRRRGPESAA